jgi:hypothetical protein
VCVCLCVCVCFWGQNHSLMPARQAHYQEGLQSQK